MTYSYDCAACGPFEAVQRISDARLRACPKCGAVDPKRLISGAPTFALIPGPAGEWGSGGYSKPANFRKAEAKLGHKVHRKL